MSRQEVIKSSWIIHISHNLTLIQQQVWNVLLAYAYDNLSKQDVHHLDVRILLSYVGKTRNILHVKKALQSLYETETYNIINKGKKAVERRVFNLLSYAAIEDGYCKYSFSPEVIPQLVNPTSYAKINLLTQGEFSSKYSLILYELCVDYSGIECTPAFTINELKTYLGIELSEYEQFKHFNYKVIKKAVEEVNAVSDLSIAAKFVSKAGKDSVVFTIKKKPRTVVDVAKMAERVLARPVPAQTQRCPFKQLKEYGVSDQKAKEIFDLFSEQEVRQALVTLQENMEKIMNPAAWLVRLFSNKRNAAPTFHPATAVPKKEYDTSLVVLRSRHTEYFARRLQEEIKILNNENTVMLKIAYEKWMAKHNFTFAFTGSDKKYREIFLIETLLCPQERVFEEWAKRQK